MSCPRPSELPGSSPAESRSAASLVLAYLATFAGVVAVLTASASGTIVGTAVLAIFAAEVLVYLAIAVYTVIPERSGSFDR